MVVQIQALDAKMSRLELEKKQTFKLMQQDTENNEREQERKPRDQISGFGRPSGTGSFLFRVSSRSFLVSSSVLHLLREVLLHGAWMIDKQLHWVLTSAG